MMKLALFVSLKKSLKYLELTFLSRHAWPLLPLLSQSHGLCMEGMVDMLLDITHPPMATVSLVATDIPTAPILMEFMASVRLKLSQKLMHNT